jgi:hypothetical protein
MKLWSICLPFLAGCNEIPRYFGAIGPVERGCSYIAAAIIVAAIIRAIFNK